MAGLSALQARPTAALWRVAGGGWFLLTSTEGRQNHVRVKTKLKLSCSGLFHTDLNKR